MRKNKRTRLFLGLCLLLVLFSQNVYASENDSKSYIWNEKTNVTTYYNNEDLEEQEVEKNSNLDLELENDNHEIVPFTEYRTFSYYDQKSKVTEYKAKYVGSVRVDNTNNTSSATISFTASNSGTWTVGVSANLSGKTEINAVVAKVDATASIGGTLTRSWSTGKTYGTSSTVAPGKIGTLEAYMTGTYTAGDLVYDVYDSYGGVTYIGRYPIGTVVPSKNDWNFVYTAK